jgi:hypothetical protein
MCRFIEGDFDELLDECRKVCYWSCAGKFFDEFLDEFSGRQPNFFFLIIIYLLVTFHFLKRYQWGLKNKNKK